MSADWVLRLCYQNDIFYISHVVMENNNNCFCQSLCIPDYYRVHASIFHVSCQLICIEMPCNREPRFVMTLYNRLAIQFPS